MLVPTLKNLNLAEFMTLSNLQLSSSFTQQINLEILYSEIYSLLLFSQRKKGMINISQTKELLLTMKPFIFISSDSYPSAFIVLVESG